MRKITILLAFLFFVGANLANAQTRTISGKVTGSSDGAGIPGVTVQVQGTTIGTVTDIDGNYSLDVAPEAEVLVYKYVGMKTVMVTIGDQTTIFVTMEADAVMMGEVVVTALGVSREKKSLGYATQEVSGDAINEVKTDNFINNLQGRAAGVSLKVNNNFGGSTNVIIRGSTSLTGNNQAMFVIDGVPVNNSTTNTAGQRGGGTGYDFGNTISDLNPEDIESMNILKGAAATALYGSRAANGVIMITTKKGTSHVDDGQDRVGITINSSVMAGQIDRSTFAVYQDGYGGGYGPYYSGTDKPGLSWEPINGVDSWVVPFTEDASFGQAFDPNLLVYQWGAFDEASPTYNQATPWVAATNGPAEFFETAWTLQNSIAFDGATDKSNYRVSYTNFDQTGIMPNSSLKKNNVTFNGSFDLTDKLTVSAASSYVNTQGKGRNSTGYSDNILSQFKQWWQVNVDVLEQKDIYDATGRNVTWNRSGTHDPFPIYWDNPYWTRYKNYETDERDRLFGHVMLNYEVNDWFSIMGRASIDTYSEIQEERRAVGSISARFGISRGDVQSGYQRFNRSFTETNFDLMANFNKRFGDDISLTGLLGTNIRRTNISSIFASTNGGLVVADLYAINNSINPVLAPVEIAEKVGVNGVFASVSLGWKNLLFLDATIRRDQSSTLPVDSADYYYPSVALSFIFSEMIDADWLQFGKVRLNYAEVGSDAPFASLYDTYAKPSPFGSITLFSIPGEKNNDALKPERTKSAEGGLAMNFFQNRLGFDFAVYKTNTVNQIMPVAVSTATGYSTKFVNAGEIQNQGVELIINFAPVVSKDFRWDVALNWSKNQNEVISLYEDVDNMSLGRFQGGVSINATIGQPFGTIMGTDYIYHDNGEPIVLETGYYDRTTTSDNVIGDQNADWNGGLLNTLTYKNWTFGFLFDWQKGGDIFSLDQWYGQGTGLYDDTDFLNDLGNPVRNSLADGGGIIQPGVKADGTPNDVRITGDRYTAFGWARNPNARYIYDASYIKLRNITLSYRMPQSVLGKSFIKGATFSLTASNVAILMKNLPYADPEAGLGAGNLQGWQSGVMPTTRNIGFSVNLQF
ncbi:MAG: SusC/RagA family TonB-linked outer membrane protein [Candidatus Brocadiales bacterium]|nr:SusC/RagA family TonB-linked outer membrane protein [Candidatus Brocadiales bacterium]